MNSGRFYLDRNAASHEITRPYPKTQKKTNVKWSAIHDILHCFIVMVLTNWRINSV